MVKSKTPKLQNKIVKWNNGIQAMSFLPLLGVLGIPLSSIFLSREI